jgi:hypothetical protein
MTTRLLRMIAAVKAVRRDTRPWAHHLTGEGHATVRRQREAVVQTLASAARGTLAHERRSRPEAPAAAVIATRRPVLTTP